MGNGSACMERTGTSRSCPSGPARQGAGRHVVGQPDALGGLVKGVAGRVHGRGAIGGSRTCRLVTKNSPLTNREADLKFPLLYWEFERAPFWTVRREPKA